jgi:hypothetical protein
MNALYSDGGFEDSIRVDSNSKAIFRLVQDNVPTQSNPDVVGNLPYAPVEKFTKLTDTPDDYTGQAGKVPVVNSTEDGLIFSSTGGGSGDMNKATYDTNDSGVVDDAEKVNGLTVETAVPTGALFTDTVYDDTAIQDEVDLNTAARHSHSNKTAIDKVIDNGTGDKYLADDGNYKTVAGGGGDTASTTLSIPIEESVLEVRGNQSEINIDNAHIFEYHDNLIETNRNALANIADASASLIEAPPSYNLPTTEQKWEFTIDEDTTNDRLLLVDDANDTITFKKAGVKYGWDTFLLFKTHSAGAKTIHTAARKASDDSLISNRQTVIDGGVDKLYQVVLPLVFLQGSEEDLEIYVTMYASDGDVELVKANSLIFSQTPSVHVDVMHWEGIWQENPPKTYYRNDVVRDDGWLSIALAETTDRPAPQHSGIVDYEIDYDGSGYQTITENVAEIKVGNVMNITQGGWMHGARFWLFNDATIEQTVVMGVINADGTFSELDRHIVSNDDITSTGYYDFRFTTPVLMFPNVKARCGVIVRSLSTLNDREDGKWVFAGIKDNTQAPWWGAWAVNGDGTYLQIHENQTDSLGVKDLSVIQVGDYIKFTQDSAEWCFQVTALHGITDNVYAFTTTRDTYSGSMVTNASTDMYAYYYDATGSQVKYSVLANGTLPIDNISGINDGVENDNLYASDFYFEEAIQSPDWDVLSVTTTGSGSAVAPVSEDKATISKGNTFTPDITFDYDEKYFNRYTQTGDINITLAANTAGQGSQAFVTLITDGNAISFPPSWKEIKNEYANDIAVYGLSILFDGDDYQYWLYYIGIYDVVIPQLTSLTANTLNNNEIDAVFTKEMDITTTGWSIDTDGAAISISSITGTGTNSPKFILDRNIVGGENLTISYNSLIGDTKDTNSNYLESITDRAVVNNIIASYPITVIDNVGLTVSAGTTLTKTGAIQSWNAGCASQQKINSGIGWIEFTERNIDLGSKYFIMMGLSHTNIDETESIEFGVYLYPTDVIRYIYSGTTGVISGYTHTHGDKYRVYVDDTSSPGQGEVSIWKYVTSDWVLIYTFSNKITMPCMFDCSFNVDGTNNANQLTALDVKIAGYDII